MVDGTSPTYASCASCISASMTPPEAIPAGRRASAVAAASRTAALLSASAFANHSAAAGSGMLPSALAASTRTLESWSRLARTPCVANSPRNRVRWSRPPHLCASSRAEPSALVRRTDPPPRAARMWPLHGRAQPRGDSLPSDSVHSARRRVEGGHRRIDVARGVHGQYVQTFVEGGEERLTDGTGARCSRNELPDLTRA